MKQPVLKIIFLLSFLLCLCVTAGKAQNYQNIRLELQSQQQNARSEIQMLRRQIIGFEEQVSRATDRYTRNYEQFRNLERESALRTAVIRSLEQERISLQQELHVTQQQIDDLNRDLKTIIDNYKVTLTHLYKHGRTSDELLLLTASSINQMLVRSYYLQRFEEYRTNQAKQIMELQEELALRESELEDAQERNRKNRADTEKEQRELEQRKRQQERQVADLRRDRDRLQQRLSATRREAASLETTLTELIEEESRIRIAEQERLARLEEERLRRLASAENIRSRREREAQIARFSDPVTPSSIPTDEQLGILEQSFEQRKGQLPWPVSSGVVSTQFGSRVNPVYGTRIDHPGIEIVTEPRSQVRAVHDGYVFAVQPISGFGNCVFVKHGRYITVYGNMSEITVNRNSMVRRGDVIGRSGDENSLKGSSLFFMIRDQNTNLDPEIWISSR